MRRDEAVHNRRLLITSWYSKGGEPGFEGPNKGSRITIVDLDTLRYRHVLLVTPTLDEDGRPQLSPLKVHAGGLVWFGQHLHVEPIPRGGQQHVGAGAGARGAAHRGTEADVVHALAAP